MKWEFSKNRNITSKTESPLTIRSIFMIFKELTFRSNEWTLIFEPVWYVYWIEEPAITTTPSTYYSAVMSKNLGKMWVGGCCHNWEVSWRNPKEIWFFPANLKFQNAFLIGRFVAFKCHPRVCMKSHFSSIGPWLPLY